jgi:hypothetical protein
VKQLARAGLEIVCPQIEKFESGLSHCRIERVSHEHSGKS